MYTFIVLFFYMNNQISNSTSFVYDILKISLNQSLLSCVHKVWFYFPSGFIIVFQCVCCLVIESVCVCVTFRCGMIYMEPHQLGWTPLRDSYMNTLPESLEDEHRTLVRRIVHVLLK